MANYVIYGTISTSDGIYDTFFFERTGRADAPTGNLFKKWAGKSNLKTSLQMKR